MSRPKSTAVKDIDIDIDIGIADILGQKYRYGIDIAKGDIDPRLVYTATLTKTSIAAFTQIFTSARPIMCLYSSTDPLLILNY